MKKVELPINCIKTHFSYIILTYTVDTLNKLNNFIILFMLVMNYDISKDVHN